MTDTERSGSRNAEPGGGRLTILALTAAIVVWGILGWLDIEDRGYGGVEFDHNFVVTRIDPATPAADSTLAVGDRISHINRIPVEDTAALARMDRTAIGERTRYWVTKFDEEMGEVVDLEFNLRSVGLDDHARTRERARILVGLTFVLLPLIAWLLSPNRATRVLVMAGLGLGLAFLSGPYLKGYDLRALFAAVEGLFVYAGLAAVVQFLLVFPLRRPLIDRPAGRRLVFFPALGLWGLLLWQLFARPPAASAAGVVLNILTGLIIGAYLLVALILLLRNFARTQRESRRALRFNTMMIGTLAAVFPVLVGNIVSAVSPGTQLPAQDYYFLSLSLIPITWSRAAMRFGIVPPQ
jgi:hypothetical protein